MENIRGVNLVSEGMTKSDIQKMRQREMHREKLEKNEIKSGIEITRANYLVIDAQRLIRQLFSFTTLPVIR